MNKIWWNGAVLKKGQIGRLIVLKDTPLYKLSGEKKTFSRTLKKGEFYRICLKPGMLGVGGGYYIIRDEKISYETPSKTKLAAVACINKEQPTGEPVQEHGDILDATKSIISFQGIPTGGFLAYDIDRKKHAHIPTYTLTSAGDYYATKEALFVDEYDFTVKGNTLNRHIMFSD